MNCNECWLVNDCNRSRQELDFCERKSKLDNLYALAMLSDQQKKRIELRLDLNKADLEAFLRLAAISKDIVNFINSGKNVYIYSSQCGNGKTSWAIRLLQEYFNKIWPKSEDTCRALFISVPRFLLAIKDNISTKSDYVAYIKENILNADVVIWDDIATKSSSQFEMEHLLSYIDGRISLGKSNIYTSNLNPAQLYAILGERITSRIANYSENIEFKGADKRNIRQGENE